MKDQRRHPATLWSTAGICLAMLGAIAASRPPAMSRMHRVEIKGKAFQPGRVEASPGDTILWVNRDSVTHTVTHTDFKSGDIAPGGDWGFIVAKAGEAAYHCSKHPTMKGVVLAR